MADPSFCSEPPNPNAVIPGVPAEPKRRHSCSTSARTQTSSFRAQSRNPSLPCQRISHQRTARNVLTRRWSRHVVPATTSPRKYPPRTQHYKDRILVLRMPTRRLTQMDAASSNPRKRSYQGSCAIDLWRAGSHQLMRLLQWAKTRKTAASLQQDGAGPHSPLPLLRKPQAEVSYRGLYLYIGIF